MHPITPTACTPGVPAIAHAFHVIPPGTAVMVLEQRRHNKFSSIPNTAVWLVRKDEPNSSRSTHTPPTTDWNHIIAPT